MTGVGHESVTLGCLALERNSAYRKGDWLYERRRPRAGACVPRFRYFYDESELKAWIPTVQQLAREADRVHVLFNNCYRDYAARNALQMADLLAVGH